MLTFHSGGIAIFVYLLSLMLTLVTTRLDDKISLYHINATLFEQSDPTVSPSGKWPLPLNYQIVFNKLIVLTE
jgi:hypothetical protein